jgi:hypothetical protein
MSTEEHDATLAAAFKRRHIGIGMFAPDLVATVRKAGWAPREETAADIVTRVRQNCTPSSDAYDRGGDYIVRAVADWIEAPPEWVKASWAAPTSADAPRSDS